MKVCIICSKMKEFCEKLPVLTCDYSVKKEIRCKGHAKPLADMSSEGYIETPFAMILLVICLISVTAGVCSCMSSLMSRCTCAHSRRKH